MNKDIKIIVYSETLLLTSCTVFSNSSFLLFSGYVVKISTHGILPTF